MAQIMTKSWIITQFIYFNQIKLINKRHLYIIFVIKYIMFKFDKIFWIFINIRVYSLSLDFSQATTNSTRTSNVQTYCSTGKNYLISSADRSINPTLFSQIGQYLQNTQSNLSVEFLYLNTTSILTMVVNPPKQIIFYSFPFLIGAGITILVSITLSFCCICPRSCPHKSFRKRKDEQYTKCELTWPIVVSFILFVFIIVASSVGISYTISFTNSIKASQCAFSIMLDDTINGNISNSGNTFFAGLSTLYSQMSDYTNNLNSTLNSLSNSFQVINNNSYTQLNNSLTQLSIMGDGISVNSSFTLIYNLTSIYNQYPPSAADFLVPSTFSLIFGNPSTPSTISYILYDTLNSLYPALSNIANYQLIVNSYISSLNTYTSYINIVGNYFNMATTADSNMSSYYTQLNLIMDQIKTLLKIYFSINFLFPVMATIGIIGIIYYNKIKLRYLTYSVCFSLLIFCLIGCVLSILLVMVNSILYYGCTSVNNSINNETSMINLFNSYGLNSNYSSLLANCIAGDGNIYNQSFINSQINIQNITYTISQLVSNGNTIQTALNSINFTTNLTTLLSGSYTQINNYLQGYANDLLPDTNTIQWLSQLSNSSSAVYGACGLTNTNFSLDSLVTSLNPLSTIYINCTTAGNATCLGTIDTCSNGCIDLDVVMYAQSNNSVNFANHLNTVFGGAGCLNLVADLVNFYNNWFLVRIDPTVGIRSLADRYISFNSSVYTLINSLSALSAINLTNIITPSNKILDSNYGIVSGSNCKTIGQDFTIFKDTICINIFNNIYAIYVIIGCVSYLSILIMIILVCFNYRYYTRYLKQLDASRETFKVHNEANMIPDRSFTIEQLN